MSFDALRRHHVENVTLSTERFAETVEVTPPGGAGRSIKASCRRTTTYEQDDESGGAKAVDTLTVTVSRDPDTGIEQPVAGYQLRRDYLIDRDRRAFRFAGEIEEEGLHSWQLVFKRALLQREGAR